MIKNIQFPVMSYNVLMFTCRLASSLSMVCPRLNVFDAILFAGVRTLVLLLVVEGEQEILKSPFLDFISKTGITISHGRSELPFEKIHVQLAYPRENDDGKFFLVVMPRTGW